MRSETQSLVAEVDAALSTASSARRASILQRTTDLFLAASETFSIDQVAVFDDVMSRLIENAERPALMEISARLASIGNAPVQVISRLSRDDDISVSGPVLRRSGALSDEILAEIAKTKGQKHLAAIAGRESISELVTDEMIDRGNSEIARAIAGNLGARISELGFVKLINQAKTDKVLATAIADRTDIPPELQPFLRLTLA